MEDGINKPIFVVGSPRSGTSILTWCLGQHPNIIPLEESGWMGDLAIDLAIYYQIGTARGEYSLLSSMNVEKAEFFAAFGKSINDLILRHRLDLERNRWRHAAGPSIPSHCFVPQYDVKTRWVDGTPEYSFHICGLRKLFPNALFVHVFRDVTSVVRSMLLFPRVSGQSLVANQEEAYRYWVRTVSNCLLAERACGPRIVFRLRHSDLIDTPEATLRSLFNFLGEPYAPECLEPLVQRINSSNVPADFKIDDRQTNRRLVDQAAELCQQVEETPQPLDASAEAVEEIEAAFDERVHFFATLASNYSKARQKIAALEDKSANITAWAERLAKEPKGGKSIIEHFRARWQRSKGTYSPLKALHKYFGRSGNSTS
jgi:hypothetical protein